MTGQPRIEPQRNGVPDMLKERSVWVCWRVLDRDGKLTKIPVNPHTGRNAKANDPATWGPFEVAWSHYADGNTAAVGIGYVFTDGGPFVGVDLDDCRNPKTGRLDDGARDVVDRLDTYTEISPSGTGVHVLVRGVLPEGRNRHDGVEMYDSSRFFTVTGDRLSSYPAAPQDRQDELASVHADYVATDSEETNELPTHKEGLAAVSSLEGRGLLKKAKEAENGEKFRRLWNGNTSGYDSHSEADLALCNLLAFYAGGDRERIDRLFRQSGLMRDKWEEYRGDQTYGELTITKALEGKTEFYNPDSGNDKSESTPRDSHPETPPEGDSDGETPGVTWKDVRGFYASDDVDNKLARRRALQLIESKGSYLALRDTEELYRYDSERGIYAPHGEQYVGERLADKLGEHYSIQEKREVVDQIRQRNWKDRDAIGGSPADPRICVANGVLNLETQELEPHSPNRPFIRHIPVEYDPGAECPAFESFLTDVVRERDIPLVYEVFGQAIYPGYLTAGTLVCYGDGRNGKSTLLHVLEELLGSDNVASRTLQELETDDFAMADLYGKLANICGDLPGDAITDTGTLKKLTGGDTVTANPKFKQPFTFENHAMLIFSANDPPKIEDDSTALYRRLLLLNFPNEFTPPGQPGPDQRPRHELRTELTTPEELSGILNKALAGIERLREAGEFSSSQDIEQLREQYKRVSDPVYAFAAECLSDDDEGWIPTEKLYHTYREWCEERDAPKKDKSIFVRELRRHKRIEKERRKFNSKRPRGYAGISLTSRGKKLLGDNDNNSTNRTRH